MKPNFIIIKYGMDQAKLKVNFTIADILNDNSVLTCFGPDPKRKAHINGKRVKNSFRIKPGMVINFK